MTLPEVLEVTHSAGISERTLKVPENLECFEGHFPNFPVVPGVVQIQWVIAVARELLGEEPVLRRVELLKFKELLTPGQVFRLKAELSTSREILDFRLYDGGRVFSSGKCVLVPIEKDRA